MTALDPDTPSNEQCPLCGMPVWDYQEWTIQVCENGAAHYMHEACWREKLVKEKKYD